MIPFNIEIRDEKSHNSRLRKSGNIPGVIYGGKQQFLVQALLSEFKKVLSSAGRNKIVQLNLENRKVLSLIKDFQIHPLSSEFIHFDLLEVDENKEVKIQVPVHIHGVPKGVREGGLLEVMHEFLELVCHVKDIPEAINLEVSNLDIGHSIHLKDIEVPNNTRFTYDEGTVIVVVTGEASSSSDEEE